jgi:predicted phosphodiesterase
MKIAIISDIHGNMEALESVLSDIRKEDCKKIFCLGDIAMAGPEPSKTIHRIQELMSSKDFYIIQGNTDKMLSVFSFDIQNSIMKVNEVVIKPSEGVSDASSKVNKLVSHYIKSVKSL